MKLEYFCIQPSDIMFDTGIPVTIIATDKTMSYVARYIGVIIGAPSFGLEPEFQFNNLTSFFLGMSAIEEIKNVMTDRLFDFVRIDSDGRLSLSLGESGRYMPEMGKIYDQPFNLGITQSQRIEFVSLIGRGDYLFLNAADQIVFADISEDPEIVQMRSGKVDNNILSYVKNARLHGIDLRFYMTIYKGLIPLAKADKVSLVIYPFETFFMADFIVIKKKNAIHFTYLYRYI